MRRMPGKRAPRAGFSLMEVLLATAILLGSLIVLGAVIGEITAEDRVELGAGGQIEGSVETSRLKVDEGARLSAKIRMREPALGSPQGGG